jgi:RNA-binding protein
MGKNAKQDMRQLRAIGHKLKPVVTVAGNTLSEGVTAELERALDDHELI